MAHPSLFQGLNETSDQELSFPDFLKLFGSLPVSPRHMYKLFSQKAVVLLYPGGAREALHRKVIFLFGFFQFEYFLILNNFKFR